jgi:hypothetical protein
MTVRSISFPARPDVHGPPSSAGFGISGFWVRQLLTTHRESARWSISLHYRIASLQGWIATAWLNASLRSQSAPASTRR